MKYMYYTKTNMHVIEKQNNVHFSNNFIEIKHTSKTWLRKKTNIYVPFSNTEAWRGRHHCRHIDIK